MTEPDDGTEPHVRQRRSWELNAEAWTEAIRAGAVASREAGTNAAVLNAVRACGPTSVLDVGCGEGWLAHALARRGTIVVGIDGSEKLIRAASDGPGSFMVADYRSLVDDPTIVAGPFDVVVCNFSLLDEDLVPLLRALRRRLVPTRGRLVVQTVHPWAANGDAPYLDGWRVERFDAFGSAFRATMPWYFRTFGSWWRTLGEAELDVVRIEEPTASRGDASDTGAPLSLLIVARPSPSPRTCR